MVKFRNPNYITPPGSLHDIISKPFTRDSIEVAAFMEHRYAFFYWNKWTRDRQLTIPPSLVSLDWHQDLCYPDDYEIKWMNKLDLTKDSDVSVFTWSKLSGNNDDHVLCAAYLNLIGDVFVNCRQGTFASHWEDEYLVDKYGNTHTIKKFDKYEDLESHMINSNHDSIYFDIDLDYFTLNNPYNGKGGEFTYMNEIEMNAILHINRPLIRWIFERIEGFTLALEPEHCGGFMQSSQLLNTINKTYFDPGLFTPSINNGCGWKHKNDNN